MNFKITVFLILVGIMNHTMQGTGPIVPKTKKYGTIFVICGPSGAGKTTVAASAIQKLAPTHVLTQIITYTTRAPRNGEINGKDYHFITPEKFKKLESEGFFFETASFNNNSYGSPISFINEAKKGVSSIIIPNIKGAKAIAELAKTPIVFIALLPPSLEALRERLQKRGTDSETVITQRLEIGKKEIEAFKQDQRFIKIVNGDLNATIDEVTKILEKNLS